MGMLQRLDLVWHPSEVHPSDARIVVGLLPLRPVIPGPRTFFERQFVQYSNGKWSYAGSDQGCRALKYWCDLPPLPKE